MKPIVLSFGGVTPNFHKATRESVEKLLQQVDSAANPMEEGTGSTADAQAVHEVSVLVKRIVDLAMGFDALQRSGTMVAGEITFLSRTGGVPTLQLRMGPIIHELEPNDG